jgi:FMN phosphatase YigB (HAD superfamily)
MRFSDDQLLIFDLGGVIIDLNYDRMINQFASNCNKDRDEIKSILMQDPLLLQYEIGGIDTQSFYHQMKEIINFNASFDKFAAAWNSLMNPLAAKKIDFLKQLSLNRRVAILSNTNDLHQRGFDEMVKQVSEFEDMKSLIPSAYYSHDMGLRKPDSSIFLHVCELENINPGKCVFFDDNTDNIKTASNLGLTTFLITYQDQIFDLLNAEKIQ